MFKYFHNRKLRFDILTLFLALILFASAVIGTFCYLKQSKMIRELSQRTIGRVSHLVSQRILCLISDLDRLAQFSNSFLHHFETISIENHTLVLFMAATLKAYPDVDSFYIANPAGDFIYVRRTPTSEEKGYIFREVLNSKKTNVETFYYKDSDLKTVKKEERATDFDPRTRPWFLAAQKTKQLHWTDVYRYASSNELGITVAIPLLNAASEMKAVIGADLPLSTLSDFVTSQQIGKTGKAYILDETGKLLLPLSDDPKVAMAFDIWDQKRQPDFAFEVEGRQYLANIHPFPVSFKQNWLIAVIAPLDEFFGDVLKEQRETILVSLAILILSSLLVSLLSKKISTPIVTLSHEIDRLEQLDLKTEKRVRSNIREINMLDHSIASMRVMLRSFGRYVPKELVKQLMQKGEELLLGGEKKEITVFFSDIENFTTIVESYPIDALMPLIRGYFDCLTQVIFDVQGTVDKYIGDSVMAFWGAPIETTKHELRACVAALRCQAALAAFNQERRQKNEPLFLTRIGIHSGVAIAGNFGTSERMNYTIMGDVVNTGFRLQQVNKLYHTATIISASVYTEVKDDFLIRPLDVVAVRGKKEKIKIYELVAKYQAEKAIMPQEWQKNLCAAFTLAYTLYEQERFQEAKELFSQIHTRYPEDVPTQIYLERTAEKSP